MSLPLLDPTKHPDDFLRWLSSTNTPTIYAETLEMQTRLHERQIRSVLGRLEAWKNAKDVLDAGCGPGNLPHQMKELVAGKRYVGIDRDHDFIIRARNKTPDDGNTRFICRDLFKFRGKHFDLIYLWAVLQHLPSIEDALQHLRSLLRPRGSILLLDTSSDEDIQLNPAVRSVYVMYKQLKKVSRSKGRNANCVGEVKRVAGDFGFRIVFEEPVRISITTAALKREYLRYVIMVSELLERFASIHTDRRAILADLGRWLHSKNSRADLGGGRWVLLRQTKPFASG